MEKENAININSFLVDQNVSTCTSINQFSDEPVRKWFKIFKFTIYLVVNYIRLEFVKYREFYVLMKWLLYSVIFILYYVINKSVEIY